MTSSRCLLRPHFGYAPGFLEPPVRQVIRLGRVNAVREIMKQVRSPHKWK